MNLPLNRYELDEYESFESTIPEADTPVDAGGKAFNQQPLYDKFVKAEVRMPHNGGMKKGTVVDRTIADDGRVYGTYNEDPHRNTVSYDVEYLGGEVKNYSASLIADNMYAQVDKDSYMYNLLDSILDHKYEKKESDQQLNSNKLAKTTRGWLLLVPHGVEQWIPLKDMKESYPVETAEYAKARQLQDKSAFRWWVPYTLKKRNAIISKVRTRVRKATHKYGIEVPRSVRQAFEIDERDGTTIWKDAIQKEMKNVGVAFQILETDEKVPVGYAKASGHMIFDVKMDFTRKARYVLDGHKTEAPDISTYAGVVSKESIRIALTYAALNGLDVCAADIQNAYIYKHLPHKSIITFSVDLSLDMKTSERKY